MDKDILDDDKTATWAGGFPPYLLFSEPRHCKGMTRIDILYSPSIRESGGNDFNGMFTYLGHLWQLEGNWCVIPLYDLSNFGKATALMCEPRLKDIKRQVREVLEHQYE